MYDLVFPNVSTNLLPNAKIPSALFVTTNLSAVKEELEYKLYDSDSVRGNTKSNLSPQNETRI